jgi:hypothetical protein
MDLLENLINEALLEETNELWLNSKYSRWFDINTPQKKGSIGTKLIKDYLERQGFLVEVISDEGDIRYKKPEDEEWIKGEAKIAKATLYKHKKSEFINEQLWYNQIRPSQEGWKGLYLAAVYPNHYRIYFKSREDWDKNYKLLDSVKKGLKHTGQEELEQVTIVKNTSRNNFNEWSLVYTTQQGGKL